jgi:hypothetical protein
MLRRKIGNTTFFTVFTNAGACLLGVSLVPEGPRRSLTSLVSPLKSVHHPFEWKIQIHFDVVIMTRLDSVAMPTTAPAKLKEFLHTPLDAG